MGILSSIGGAVKKVVSKVSSVIAPKKATIPSYTSATKPANPVFKPAPANKVGTTTKNVAAATMPTGKATSATVLKAIDAGPTAAAKVPSKSSSGGGSKIGSAVNKVVSKATEAASEFVNAAKSNTDVSGGFHLKQPSAMDALALTTGAPVGKVAGAVGKVASSLKSDEELVKLAYSGARGDSLANKALDQLSPENLKRLELLIKSGIAGPEGRTASAALEQIPAQIGAVAKAGVSPEIVAEIGASFKKLQSEGAALGKVALKDIGVSYRVGQLSFNTKMSNLVQQSLSEKLLSLVKSPATYLAAAGITVLMYREAVGQYGMSVWGAGEAIDTLTNARGKALTLGDTEMVKQIDDVYQATTNPTMLDTIKKFTPFGPKAIVDIKKEANDFQIRLQNVGAEVDKEILVIGSSIQEAVMAKDQLGQPNWSITAPTEQTLPTEVPASTFLTGYREMLDMKSEQMAADQAAYYAAQKANDAERAALAQQRIDINIQQQQKMLDFWDDYQDKKADDQAAYFDEKYAEFVKEQEYYAANYKNTERSHLNFGLLK